MTSTPFSSPTEEPRRRTSRPGDRARLLPLLAPILAVLLWPAGAPAQTAGAEPAGRTLTRGDDVHAEPVHPGGAVLDGKIDHRISLTRGRRRGGLGYEANTLIICAIIVLLMTYVVMPFMTKLFKGWLFSK